jgi:flagellar hook-associated protein FlgK
MASKLTLTVDKKIIVKAKVFARNQGRSLSNLIEDYLKALTSDQKSPSDTEGITPLVKSLKGSLKSVGEEFDYEKQLTEELSKKYLSH